MVHTPGLVFKYIKSKKQSDRAMASGFCGFVGRDSLRENPTHVKEGYFCPFLKGNPSKRVTLLRGLPFLHVNRLLETETLISILSLRALLIAGKKKRALSAVDFFFNFSRPNLNFVHSSYCTTKRDRDNSRALSNIYIVASHAD